MRIRRRVTEIETTFGTIYAVSEFHSTWWQCIIGLFTFGLGWRGRHVGSYEGTAVAAWRLAAIEDHQRTGGAPLSSESLQQARQQYVLAGKCSGWLLGAKRFHTSTALAAGNQYAECVGKSGLIPGILC